MKGKPMTEDEPIREYDANGNPTSVKYSSGYWKRYDYNSNGNLIYCRDSDGYEGWYDSKGNTIDKPTKKEGKPMTDSSKPIEARLLPAPRSEWRTHWRSILVVLIVTFGLVAALAAAAPPPSGYDTDRILDAIRQVETGGERDPANAVGDGGKAIGPFQIHRAYWQDAVEWDPSIGGKYEDCKKEAYARRVVIAYLSRYCNSWTDETVARIHNGGPKGHKRSSTIGYWKRVQRVLN